MNNNKKIIEYVLIILMIISAISFPNIYPVMLSLTTITIVILERKNMNQYLLGISCLLWIIGTVIYLIRLVNQ